MIDFLWLNFLNFLALTWWFWVFLFLAPLAVSAWSFWSTERFKQSQMKSVLLELRIPREVTRSVKAMEQVLMAIHSLRNEPSDFGERWFDGEITRWYSLELVSFGGEIHFYMRTYFKQKPLVEAAFFAYYPDVELAEVDDYVGRLPQNVKEMYRQGYDIWGSEMMLVKPSAYPIKTYPAFESPEEEKQYDPISAFLEVLAKIKKEEIVGIQILISPTNPRWKNQYNKLVEKLRFKQSESEQKVGTNFDFSEGKILPALSVKGQGKDAPPMFPAALIRTPGETDVLKAVENNLSKSAFDTIIRFFYLSPRPLFYDSFARRAITGAFNQYAALDLNSFVRNEKMSTRTKLWYWPHLFPETRVEWRKQRLIYNYRHREMTHPTYYKGKEFGYPSFMGKLLTSYWFNFNFASKSVKLTTEELATLYHPPTFGVLTAPHMMRVESRKVGPPAGLPIYGEEKGIEKFQ